MSIMARLLTPQRVLGRVRRTAARTAWSIKWRGRSYSEYQRQHMDTLAETDPREAVGGLWDEIGQLQLDVLKRQGLNPQHRLLDIGCGSLRGGLHMIRYLESGHYWGTELSERLLDAGREFLREEGLQDKDPHLVVVDGFSFKELQGQQFDFVQAFGVFTDIPAELVRECVANLSRVLAPGGAFYASFGPAKSYMPDHVRVQFRYPWSFFQELAAEHGYSISLVPDVKHPKGHAMLALRRDGAHAPTT